MMQVEKPIRILCVFGRLNCGGAETMCMNLYRAIDRKRIQFDFVKHTSEKDFYEDEILELGGRIYECPRYIGTNHTRYIGWWKEFFSRHSEHKIVHMHIRSVASICIPVAKKYNRFTIAHSHSTSNGNGFVGFIKTIMQIPVRWQADFFFSCSIKAGEWMFGKRIANSSLHMTIPNAIDTKIYEFSEEIRSKYRHQLGLEGKKVFIHVGRLHPAKNHDFLLEVFEEVYENDSFSILLLVGAGELYREVKEKISNLGLSDSVKMLGMRDDIPNLLQAADVFLFPSKWEGLPTSVIEAQAAGLPCLISDRITEDVAITDLVIRLPIDQGNDVWILEIEQLDYARKNVIEEIKKAGFDVRKAAQQLANFYEKAWKE